MMKNICLALSLMQLLGGSAFAMNFLKGMFDGKNGLVRVASLEECKICTSEVEKGDVSSFCNDRSHKACRDCQVNHAQAKVLAGNHQVICMFADPELTFNSERAPHCVLEEVFVPCLDEHAAMVFSATKQRVEAVKLGYAPCTKPDCPGMIEGGEEGKLCEVCSTPYCAEVYPPGTRHCGFCYGAIQKDGGCDTIMCGHCHRFNNWQDCRLAKTKKKCCCIIL